jgi:alkanesulfonate monooxygenase SsuD/methylene tetrahydromethanopterin reductase-like flavin-dependent oxidoreductase (luciferase family)
MPWADAGVPPIWVAGYGPKALRCAGKIGDGVILQFADPHLIKWCLNFVREGAEEAGRDFSKIKVMSAAPVWVSPSNEAEDLAAARERVRWFPAMVGNHVADLVSRYNPDELPPELTAYIKDRKGYDYLHHGEVGSSNAQFVTDEVVDRFAIVGPVAEQVRRLNELKDAGVTQFNIYLMCGDEEQTVEVYGNEVIPAALA